MNPDYDNLDYHRGFVSGLMYPLAQLNDGKAIMGPMSVPKDELNPKLLQEAMHWINEEAGIAGYHLEEDGDHYYNLWVATTENDQPLPDHWEETI